jgi:hypothetical protein
VTDEPSKCFTSSPNSNDVLLGYANAGDNGNVDYGRITTTPGQFNPGDEIYGLANDINGMHLTGGMLEVYGIGAALGATGGTACALFCGELGVGTVTTLGATVGGTAGPLVSNPDLQAWVDEMFQPTDKIPGGIAGAVRYEARTGILLSPAGHFQEAAEILGHLNEMIRDGGLSVHDQVVAKQLAQDLAQSLSVAKSWGVIK